MKIKMFLEKINPKKRLALRKAQLSQKLNEEDQKNAHKRKYARHETFIVSHFSMMSNSMKTEGAVMEISAGGAKFRPASAFIQNKDGDTVNLQIGEMIIPSKIRASRPDGYGLQFFTSIDEETLNYVLEQQTEGFGERRTEARSIQDFAA